jgi:hypothetical protein
MGDAILDAAGIHRHVYRRLRLRIVVDLDCNGVVIDGTDGWQSLRLIGLPFSIDTQFTSSRDRRLSYSTRLKNNEQKVEQSMHQGQRDDLPSPFEDAPHDQTEKHGDEYTSQTLIKMNCTKQDGDHKN